MSFDIGPLPPIQPTSAPRRSENSGFTLDIARTSAPATTDTVQLSLPPYPPREVLDEVDAAAERVDELAAMNRELHFSTDAETGRVIVEVRDLDGNVIRTIPPSHALDVMAGAGL